MKSHSIQTKIEHSYQYQSQMQKRHYSLTARILVRYFVNKQNEKSDGKTVANTYRHCYQHR